MLGGSSGRILARMVYQISIRIHGAAQPRRRLWRTTFRSASCLSIVLLGDWRVWTRVYRWKWLAKLAARWHVLAAPSGVLTSAFVEPLQHETDVVWVECRSPQLVKAFSS